MSSKRLFHPDYIHLVTSRTLMGMFTLTPTRAVKEIISAWFVRTREEYAPHIEIYAFTFLSNHFHILLRDPAGELPAFMREFKSKCARELNRHYGRRGIPVWPEKYDDRLIVDDESFIEALTYLLCNPVKHGLVGAAASWRGVSSLPGHLKSTGFVARVFRRTEYRIATRHGRKVKRSEFVDELTLALTPPPFWQRLGAPALARQFGTLIESGNAHYRSRWRRSAPIGMPRILRQSPFAVPRKKGAQSAVPASAREDDGRFRCKDKVRRKELEAWFGELMGRYRETFLKYVRSALQTGRKKKAAVFVWPPGTYPPSSIRPVFCT